MGWLGNLLIVVQVLCAVAVVILVLLQHGKGADMGAAFGGGASGSLFGATGSANFLSRSTAVAATIFFIATIGLAYTSTSLRGGHEASGGVMSGYHPTGDGAAVPAAPAGTKDGGAAVPKNGNAANAGKEKSTEIPK